eukprot:11205820-Lingulodinium_polyedra.AAC.1
MLYGPHEVAEALDALHVAGWKLAHAEPDRAVRDPVLLRLAGVVEATSNAPGLKARAIHRHKLGGRSVGPDLDGVEGPRVDERADGMVLGARGDLGG